MNGWKIHQFHTAAEINHSFHPRRMYFDRFVIYKSYNSDSKTELNFLHNATEAIYLNSMAAILYFSCCGCIISFYDCPDAKEESLKDVVDMMMSSNGTIFRLLDLCVGNSPVTGEFPSQRTVWNFDVFFDLCLNKQLSKQSRCQWFEMQSHSLWHHSNEIDKI